MHHRISPLINPIQQRTELSLPTQGWSSRCAALYLVCRSKVKTNCHFPTCTPLAECFQCDSITASPRQAQSSCPIVNTTNSVTAFNNTCENSLDSNQPTPFSWRKMPLN